MWNILHTRTRILAKSNLNILYNRFCLRSGVAEWDKSPSSINSSYFICFSLSSPLDCCDERHGISVLFKVLFLSWPSWYSIAWWHNRDDDLLIASLARAFVGLSVRSCCGERRQTLINFQILHPPWCAWLHGNDAEKLAWLAVASHSSFGSLQHNPPIACIGWETWIRFGGLSHQRTQRDWFH